MCIKPIVHNMHLVNNYIEPKGWNLRWLRTKITDRNRIGADSTGATGNFAPVLTQEPGQTLRFAPVPFMAVLWFLKW